MLPKHFPQHYSVAPYKGKPAFFADGVPVVLPGYCSCGPSWREQWIAAHRRFAQHGCKVFWLTVAGGYNGEWGTTPFWTGPGEIHSRPVPMPPEYFGIDEQAKVLIEIEPEARFFIRMNDNPPQSWGEACPDEMQLNCDGKRYDAASLASQKYLSEISRYLRALTRHCEKSDWAERIIGYVMYPMAEGATPLACEGFLFDQAPVMQDEFRRFLKKKYRSDARLRKAWNNVTVNLKSPDVPGDSGFRSRQEKVLFWPDARQVQRERDYFELQTSLFRRYCKTMLTALRSEAGPNRLYGIDALKGNMLGWMTHPVFSGQRWKEYYGDQFLATGTTGMAEILDWPELDIVATPHDYRNRWVGFGYDPEGIGDSVALHGKIMLVEEDQRSYTNNERGLFGSIEPGEEEAVLYRNLAATISRGHQTYPMDVCVGYFESDEIQRVLARRREIEAEFLHREREDVPSVVMLVDDHSGFYTDFSAQYNELAIVHQRIHGMNHCGVPTRTYLFDDLKRDDFPSCHKLFILPNLFKFDAERLELLRKKLFRNGNVIVFGPGSGITDGSTPAPDFARQLMGIHFELLDYEYPRFVKMDNFDHPLTQGFGAAEYFGDTHRYGPVLVPRELSATDCITGAQPQHAAENSSNDGFIRLGTIALDNGKRRAGLVVKEFGRGAVGNGREGQRCYGDYALVFTTAVPLPARLLRNLARYSGTHIYNEEDDVVYADSTMVAVHAVKPGRRTIHLPERFNVSDVITGAQLQNATQTLGFTVRQPGTRWFGLKKP